MLLDDLNSIQEHKKQVPSILYLLNWQRQSPGRTRRSGVSNGHKMTNVILLNTYKSAYNKFALHIAKRNSKRAQENYKQENTYRLPMSAPEKPGVGNILV